MNNCIAADNLKFFLQFLVFVLPELCFLLVSRFYHYTIVDTHWPPLFKLPYWGSGGWSNYFLAELLLQIRTLLVWIAKNLFYSSTPFLFLVLNLSWIVIFVWPVSWRNKNAIYSSKIVIHFHDDIIALLGVIVDTMLASGAAVFLVCIIRVQVWTPNRELRIFVDLDILSIICIW